MKGGGGFMLLRWLTKTVRENTTKSTPSSILQRVKEAFKDASDFEAVCIGQIQSEDVYLCYLSTLVASDRLFFTWEEDTEGEFEAILRSFSGKKVSEAKEGEAAIQAILAGKTLLCTARSSASLALETEGVQSRSISTPLAENVIHGPMDAFVEDLATNISLIRRRIKSEKLIIWQTTVGTLSKTNLALLHMGNVADEKLVQYAKDKIESIAIDGIQDTGQLRELLTNRKGFQIYPLMLVSERPDRVAASLLAGRMVLVLDGTPFVLIAPSIFLDYWHSPEDYYMAPLIASFIRILRFIAMFSNLFLPALYVAFTSVNTDVNRLEITLAVAASREGVPYPVVVETILMLLVIDLIIEAAIRMPKTIGATVTMVGGVVFGQAIVAANIVSNLLIIIVAATALTNFIVTDYSMGLVHRFMKYGIVFFAATIGLLGVVMSLVLLVIHLSQLESFGVSYLSPMGPWTKNDLKDSIFRAPLSWLKRRPEMLNPRNDRRLK